MKKFALIGKPLGHSLSPQIHVLISEITGLPCSYELRPLELDDVKPFLRDLKAEGLDGVNVTIPYKRTAYEAVDMLSSEAKAIGAVNTVAVTAKGLTGYNTDYHGFGAMLQAAGIVVKGERSIILGSGGGARAAAAWLADAGASEVLIASRDAQEASARFPGLRAVSYGELENLSGSLLVNCTPLGMHPHPEGCPVPESVVAHFSAVADLVYNPRVTRLLAMAASFGLKLADGLYMLAAQAVCAREIWHGVQMGAGVERLVYERLAKALEGNP